LVTKRHISSFCRLSHVSSASVQPLCEASLQMKRSNDGYTPITQEINLLDGANNVPDTQYSLVHYSLSACMCTFTDWYTCDTRVSRSKIFNEIRTAHPTSSVNVDFNLQFLCCHHQDNLYLRTTQNQLQSASVSHLRP